MLIDLVSSLVLHAVPVRVFLRLLVFAQFSNLKSQVKGPKLKVNRANSLALRREYDKSLSPGEL